MEPDRVEYLEQTVVAMVTQALIDYRDEAITIFCEETDHPQDIAEDILREAIDTMGLSEMHERLYGKVDLKKAIYVFAPEVEPVALMLDAKAEKDDRTATIQMSQTSMTVNQERSGSSVSVEGGLDSFITRSDRRMLVVTVIAKFVYHENNGNRALERIMVACIPNGLLQDRYNPNTEDTIWKAGRNAPTLGEDFRVRLDYRALKAKAAWRVCDIECVPQ
ncbi:MAG: type II restriction endonuclease [Acidimicrobiaceae bacterium]|nr:type II restriction endonuclease [Acidimicrobiaceae bacterium]MYG54092.1 type II restriction endonuclease [Acidimicrobiaceae bacterium]MYK00160.1 type II restriction endonuclease [Acidimicrobiaceae bacterium]